MILTVIPTAKRQVPTLVHTRQDINTISHTHQDIGEDMVPILYHTHQQEVDMEVMEDMEHMDFLIMTSVTPHIGLLEYKSLS